MKIKKTQLPKQFYYHVIELDRSVLQETGDGAVTIEDDAPVPLILSTENPIERSFGTEVLSHSKSAVDLSLARTGLSLLVEHGGHVDPWTGTASKVDPEKHIGVVDNIRIEDKKLKGDATFSDHPLAQQIRAEVVKGTRRYGSLGWQPVKAVDKVNQNEQVTERTWTRWKPVEHSIVSIPANSEAVAGARAAASGGEMFPVEVQTEATSATQEEHTMKVKKKGNGSPGGGHQASAGNGGGTGGGGGTAVQPKVEVVTDHGNGVAQRNAESAEIIAMCEANGLAKRAPEFIQAGLSKDRVAYEIFKARQSGAAPQPGAELVLDIPEKDRKSYSYVNLIRSLVDQREGKPATVGGREREVHQELEKKMPPQYRSNGGMLIPLSLRGPNDPPRRKAYAMGSTIQGGGTETIFDSPGDLIEFLSNRARVIDFGAEVLTSLTGPVPFPKETNEPDVFWVGENPDADVPESELNFGIVTLSPKTMQGTIKMPRQLIVQSSIDMEDRARRRLGDKHGLVFDLAALHGSGVDGQPSGIHALADVQIHPIADTVNGFPAYGDLIDMQGLTADANADIGTPGYMTTALMAARLRKTLRASAAGSDYIWEGTQRDGMMAGERATSTNQVRKDLGAGADEHGLVYGDWSTVTIGMWGNAMEVVVDPYTLARKGQIRLTTFQMADLILRYPQAFVRATGAKVA